MGIDLNNINLLTITPPKNNIFGGVYFNEAPSDLFTGYNNGTNNDVFNENVFNNTGTSPSSIKLVTFKEMFKNAKENAKKSTRRGSIESAMVNSTNNRPVGNSDKKVLENRLGDIKTVYTTLKNKTGLDDNSIYGILGNIYVESGFNPTIEGDLNTAHHSIGLIQWRADRRDSLVDFAERNGKQLDNVQTQAEFLAEELKNKNVWTRGYDLSALKVAENPTLYFGRAFVRPNEKYADWNKRTSAATYIAALLNK